jgi:protein-tyrosine-phosphatase
VRVMVNRFERRGVRARSVLRTLRHFPDRVLHRLRRGRAASRVREARPAQSILFVCQGNINRSAYGAAALSEKMRGISASGPRIVSAGFIGPDRHVPVLSQEVASRHGVDLADHVSRLVTPDLVKEADLVLAMDRRQRVALKRMGARRVELLGDFDPQPIRTRTIRDPWGNPERVVESVFSRIDRCIDVLAEALGGT